jgi:hypothetical protein
LLGGALPAAPATAQSGVHVDPGSPAGKEYALPLDQARREARGGGSGGAGQKSPTGRSALFGEGIKPGRSHGAGTTGSGSARAKGGRSRAQTPASGAAARLSAPATAGGGSPALTDGGIALAVLLAAGGLGLLLRRVLR